MELKSLEENLHVGLMPQSAVLRPLKSDFVVMLCTVGGNLQHIGDHQKKIAMLVVVQFACPKVMPVDSPEGTPRRTGYGDPDEGIPPRDQLEGAQNCPKAGGGTKVARRSSEAVRGCGPGEPRIG